MPIELGRNAPAQTVSARTLAVCPCCGNRGFERLIDFGSVPISGWFRSDPREPAPSAELAFDLCNSCGLVRQLPGAAPRDYGATTRSTAKQFPAYGQALIERLASLGVGPNDLIVDVGSNDGVFLDALRTAGFSRLVGVEPSRQLADSARARGLRVENDYFGPHLVPDLLGAHGPARAIVCRHTLEHVPDPAAFVPALRDCLAPEGGVALLEVPDGAAIPDLMNVYEFWDEHLYCFCAENLARLLDRVGMPAFDAQVQPHLETRNLLLWCGRGRARAPEIGADRDCVALWRGLPARWAEFRERFGAALRDARRPIYLIGGSHSQYNIANYAGIGRFVDHLIDDDPAKLGGFPPILGASPSIISTARFESSARSGTVLITGFGYAKWTARICGHAAKHGMQRIDPRDFIPAASKDGV
ncbi:MAG TPA: methyltransferase domain-containing protein [Candidatus Binataceae bacterium]|nr:methyltransferase domain-containing protein [Candidatus Binataceae bacterium]